MDVCQAGFSGIIQNVCTCQGPASPFQLIFKKIKKFNRSYRNFSCCPKYPVLERRFKIVIKLHKGSNQLRFLDAPESKAGFDFRLTYAQDVDEFPEDFILAWCASAQPPLFSRRIACLQKPWAYPRPSAFSLPGQDRVRPVLRALFWCRSSVWLSRRRTPCDCS